MTSITTANAFNQSQLTPLVYMASPPPLFFSSFANKLVHMLGDPREQQWFH